MCLVETHLQDGEGKKIEGFKKVASKGRIERGGGGMLVLCKPKLYSKMQMIPSEKEDTEVLWVKLETSDTNLKIGLVYFPQEQKTRVKEIKEIYKELDKEVKKSREKEETMVIIGDFNCKIGTEIRGNYDLVTKGGKILKEWTKKQELLIVNTTDKCRGLWTREEGGTKSVLDYMLINKEKEEELIEMLIDEEREMAPYGEYETRKVYSDHFTIMVTMNTKLSVERKKTSPRKIMTKKGINKYKKLLQQKSMRQIIKKRDKLEDKYNKWSKCVKEAWQMAKTKWKKMKDNYEVKHEKIRK